MVAGSRIPEIKVVRPQASFLVWLDCSGLNLNATKHGANSELCQFIEHEAKLKLSDGFSFGGEATGHFQRINVACSRAMLCEALERLETAVKRLRKSKL